MEILKDEIELISEKLIYQKIEDEILNNLRNADLKWLNMLKNEYKWQYYGKDVTDKILDKAILRKTRLLKLIRLKEISERPELLCFFPGEFIED
jgi:hypothetical protein